MHVLNRRLNQVKLIHMVLGETSNTALPVTKEYQGPEKRFRSLLFPQTDHRTGWSVRRNSDASDLMQGEGQEEKQENNQQTDLAAANHHSLHWLQLSRQDLDERGLSSTIGTHLITKNKKTESTTIKGDFHLLLPLSCRKCGLRSSTQTTCRALREHVRKRKCI